MHARITLRGGARNERVVEFLRVFVDGKVRLVVNVKIFVREIARIIILLGTIRGIDRDSFEFIPFYLKIV